MDGEDTMRELGQGLYRGADQPTPWRWRPSRDARAQRKMEQGLETEQRELGGFKTSLERWAR